MKQLKYGFGVEVEVPFGEAQFPKRVRYTLGVTGDVVSRYFRLLRTTEPKQIDEEKARSTGELIVGGAPVAQRGA